MSSAPGKSAAGKLATIAPLPQPRSLAHELIARLTADITGGRIPPGARLPTEQELIAATGVSRTVVREAVAALRAEGLVVTRQGVGAFVAGQCAPAVPHRRRPAFVAARGARGHGAAHRGRDRGSGARRRARLAGPGPQHRRRLAAVDDALRRGEDAIDQDFAFHCSIADATGNPQFLRLLEYLGRLIIPRQTIQGGPGIPRRLYSETFQKEHREIVQAIRAASGRAGTRRDAPAPSQQPQALPEVRRADSATSERRSRMQRVLITGAAGGIGTRLRKLLAGRLPGHPAERPRAPCRSLSRRGVRSRRPRGDGRGGAGGRGRAGHRASRRTFDRRAWDTILEANIVGCYNLFEAARRHGVERVVFASSNHAVGFYPRRRRIGVEAPVRPDSRYGVSKAFGEALAALYAYKHGLRVTSPAHRQRHRCAAATSGGCRSGSSPEDLVQLVRIGLEHPDIRCEIFYGVSDNARGWWDNAAAFRFGYRPRARSEDHSAAALAADGALPPDPVGEWYQGGPYCSDEFDHGIECAPL